ncbi:endonuclease [Marivirga sp. S37H4]|uniref:Endonuclease n=1 Tax=Marivirga aurantiaca TaxID=2802615 RepID=A0A934WYD8_9BACT|nr:endonuclease [Marivirga aurantiaca]MBK6265162.1 endonuclease [Marivirga aurantiaca]
MKILYSLTVFLFLNFIYLLPTNAQVLNASFEDWSGNNPTAWTTIDSGISLNQEGALKKDGSYSARITVNTPTQSNTDFLQTITVNPGQTYTFSAWVYHTEGGVRARLYVDGYRNYSNPSQLNQWQQLTFEYTPSSSNIEVGFRFYDVSGFDGSEVVYIDNFEPATSSGGGGGDTGGGCTDVALTLTADNYASETSWVIKDANGTTLHSGSNYSNNTTYNEIFCLDDGNYSFVINDSYGDGICCSYGNGSYSLTSEGNTLGSGGAFSSSETVNFTIGSSDPGNGGGGDYYNSASGLSGYALKTELHNIIKGHNSQGYNAIWTFYSANELDYYYENDGTILDIYSEKPGGSDSYSYTKSSDQCGNYSGEGSCYNREHSFPRSWFGGTVEPMNSDVHHIFATDGYVNSKRASYPYGEVSSASYVSSNGSKLGSSVSGYNGTVFEPIDEFKGDLARAAFYMATRYQNVIAGWENNSSYSDAILDGSSNKVFENWTLDLLISWHNNDPVSAKEIARNEAAFAHQGNRNPFVDHPEYVSSIWGSGSSARTLNETSFTTSYEQEQLTVEHGITDPVNVVVFDASGRKLIEYTSEADQSPVTELSVLLEPNSLYIVKVFTKDKMMSKKLVIME